ncbi:MAG: putative membrane protein YedE/YeeE [Candidatus Azotimanducaceae bacterium]
MRLKLLKKNPPSKYREKSDWGISYGWMLVLGMLFGGSLTPFFFKHKQPKDDKGSMTPMWRAKFGPSEAKRYSASLAGGFLLLFGARLAGGCTSGHMISGISQLAVS